MAKNKNVTLKEFKEWLNKFPDETIILVGVQQAGSNWERYGSVEFESPDIENEGATWELFDLRNNQYVKDQNRKKIYLHLGGKE